MLWEYIAHHHYFCTICSRFNSFFLPNSKSLSGIAQYDNDEAPHALIHSPTHSPTHRSVRSQARSARTLSTISVSGTRERSRTNAQYAPQLSSAAVTWRGIVECTQVRCACMVLYCIVSFCCLVYLSLNGFVCAPLMLWNFFVLSASI